MRIVIKPLGVLFLLGMLAVLVVVALRPYRGMAGEAMPSAATAAADTIGIHGQQNGEPSPATIYDGKLQNGWENYSWAKVIDLEDTKHAPPGQSACIRAVPEGYQAVYLHHAPFRPEGYDRLTFSIHGGETGGQALSLHVLFPEVRAGSPSSGAAKKAKTAATGTMGENATYGKMLAPLPAQRWRAVTVRLADFGIRGQQKMIGFWLQNATPNASPEFYISDIRFLAPGDPDPAAN